MTATSGHRTRRTVAALALLVSTGCATVTLDPRRPLERSFGGGFSQGGERVDRGDALAALDAYEPSREDVRSARRCLGGAAGFGTGGVVLLLTAVVPSDLPDRMRIAMAGSALAMVYAIAVPLWITSEVRERRAVGKYDAQFAPTPRASARIHVLPFVGGVPDATGHPAPAGGFAVAF